LQIYILHYLISQQFNIQQKEGTNHLIIDNSAPNKIFDHLSGLITIKLQRTCWSIHSENWLTHKSQIADFVHTKSWLKVLHFIIFSFA